jgi:hypothetical protein
MEGSTLFIRGEPATKSLGAEIKKYNMNNMKTTEKMRVMIGKEFGCLWAKIRETISGSACVLD